MRIGFDAKRAYHNQTGLGHYSRTLIRSLATNYPAHSYWLMNPRPSKQFHFQDLSNVTEVLPQDWLSKGFPSLWRSSWMNKDLQRLELDLYHGLSHELPAGIAKTGIPSVVTMHDLIFERYPDQYKRADRMIYRYKFQQACKQADRIIAISRQTKVDLVELYGVPESKIDVCYQSCNPAFAQPVSEQEKLRVRNLYQLPEQFFLYVGSIIERKNLLNICKAMTVLSNEVPFPLVIIGGGGAYKQQVQEFILQHQLDDRCIFLSDHTAARNSSGFQTAADFPAIYQQALAMIYPSFYEGFGIPVLEGLWSGIPVITSNSSCLPEAGGAGAFYVNPGSPEEIAQQMKSVVTDPLLVQSHFEKTKQHLVQFTNQATTARVMDVYRNLLQR